MPDMTWFETDTPRPVKPPLNKKPEISRFVSEGSCCISGRGYATHYFDESSLHGVKYFGGTSITMLCEKIVWFLIFFGSFGLFCYTVIPLFQDHIDGATTHVQQIRSEEQIQYPAVTICNPNQYRRLIIGGDSMEYFKISKFADTTLKMIKQQCTAPSLIDLLNRTNAVVNNLAHPAFYTSRLGFSGMMSFFRFQDSFIEGFMIKANSIWGHDAYQSVISCKFRGVKFSDEECYGSFINRMTDKGLCFTFNVVNHFRVDSRSAKQQELLGAGSVASNRYPFLKNDKDEAAFISTMRGSESSVELLLNVRQFEYCDVGGDSTAGLSLYIHSRDILPMSLAITESAIKLSPGTETSILLQRVEYERDTEKIGGCTSTINEKYFPHLPMYDQNVCFAECLINMVIEQCNCLPDFSPDAAVDFILRKKNLLSNYSNPTELFCLVKNDRLCYRMSYRSFTRENRPLSSRCPKCQLPCQATSFDHSLSYGQFPAINKFDQFKDHKFAKLNYSALRTVSGDDHTFQNTIDAMEALDFRHLNLSNEFKDIEEVRSNLILIRISLATMTTLVKQDKLDMTTSRLLSSLGGSIGLYIGASILSFVEILFWIYICLCKKDKK